jgi:hypothetical protein
MELDESSLLYVLRKCHNWYIPIVEREDVVGKHDAGTALITTQREMTCHGEFVIQTNCLSLEFFRRLVLPSLPRDEQFRRIIFSQKEKRGRAKVRQRPQQRYNPPGNLNNNSHLNI